MSRHILEPHPHLSHLNVIIGWDPGLRVWYLQVLEPAESPDGGDDIVLWTDTAPGKKPTLNGCIELARRYAKVPLDLGVKLAHDAEHNR